MENAGLTLGDVLKAFANTGPIYESGRFEHLLTELHRDAMRWRKVVSCARIDGHGDFVVSPLDPHAAAMVHASFEAAVDEALRSG